MINENMKKQYHHIFCLTSKNQPNNSDGLLFPYDRYIQTELFLSDDDRTFFDEKCKEIIDDLKYVMSLFLKANGISCLKLFITEGYDDMFVKKCTINEMGNFLLNEIQTSFSIDSVIFELSNKSNLR